ncbi:hypothetical protein ACJVC5_14950 [Peredibacter sp. HCB2-198]
MKLKDEDSEKEIPTDSISYEKLLDVLRNLRGSGLTSAKKLKIVRA